MKAYEWNGGKAPCIFNLDGDGHLCTVATLAPDIHWMGGWVGCKACLDMTKGKVPAPTENCTLVI